MVLSIEKGKGKAIENDLESITSASSSDSEFEASGSSNSDSLDSDSDSEPEITQSYLNSLLEKAKQNAIERKNNNSQSILNKDRKEEVLTLEDHIEKPLPSLDPGQLPKPYFASGKSRREGPSSIRDPDVEVAEAASSSLSVPEPPIPPAEITKSGKPLTKREKKAMKKITAGPDWFDLPAPAEADLPRLHREVESLRLRNQLDPKRFYKKDEGEGKGINGLPRYFAIGTILPSSTPFGTVSADNLTRAQRKRTLVDELVDDAEAKRYTKKKFGELQSVRGARGRNTLHAKRAMRRGKW